MSVPHDIQVLTATDLKPLRAMLSLFGRAFEDPETFEAQPPSDDYLRGLLQSEFFVAIAALRGQQVIGGITGYVLPKYERARRELYIYDLAVAEAHRRAGVATALIGEARRLAGQRGIDGIFVQADLGDGPAIALYGKLGRKAEVLHFDIEPEAAPGTSLLALERPATPSAASLAVTPIGTVRAAR